MQIRTEAFECGLRIEKTVRSFNPMNPINSINSSNQHPVSPQTLCLTKITKVKSLMADNIITNKFDTYLILS